MSNGDKLIVITKIERVFNNLLLLYPDSYRKKFGEEMIITFEDIYREKLTKDGKLGILFWVKISLDIIKSALEQQSELLKRLGMKKYLIQTFHVNKYNIVGGVLLLPFLTMFAIDLIARIVQGDMTRYNRPVYVYISHTPLYWTPVLFSIVILFPLLAVLFNLIPLIVNALKKHTHIFHLTFLKQNSIALAIVLVSLSFLAIIKLHDFAPCMVHGIIGLGVGEMPKIISICKNA
jgi:hypothetical protein